MVTVIKSSVREATAVYNEMRNNRIQAEVAQLTAGAQWRDNRIQAYLVELLEDARHRERVAEALLVWVQEVEVCEEAQMRLSRDIIAAAEVDHVYKV